jgi:hypothetical protein
MCRERDTEGGEGGRCGRALDKLWGRLVAWAGRTGTLRWGWRGGCEREIGKGLSGCASWNMRGDCLGPLADAVGAGFREREGMDAGGCGGLGVGETRRGAVWTGEAILCELSAHCGDGAQGTHEFALAGKTPVDVHGTVLGREKLEAGREEVERSPFLYIRMPFPGHQDLDLSPAQSGRPLLLPFSLNSII